ncbi:IclR family transcriptional regulator domain-containing protein [Telmatospirillum siberiense]|uniref:IclR family transcriptional regulator n=1 Tax=Telmatospirillum siberiense TaxID=382514 RepID=A0A2N3PUT7_9PROT|nr:IclR family transcriptional regulator C-terminal domain-containing protein [Telmatospirillum siberiense]PKU24155.1 IclR family transcriptional regulator [Telmatospirillum siberiense]
MIEPKTAEAVADDRNFMTSLARGLTVIRAFSEQTSNLTIADVAKITGLPRAAARRCLLTLTQLGYAGTDGRVFFLRPKVLALGYSFLSSAPLATVLDPVLSQVSRTLEESSSAAVLDEEEVVYIARVATKRIMSLGLNIGSRLPAYCTSMGRVLLASLPPEDFEAYLKRVTLKPFTAQTVTAKSEFKSVIEETRAKGYALIDQELEIGLRSLAVPVKNPSGVVVAAINVSTQAARVEKDEMIGRFLPVLRTAADEARLLLVR